MLEQTAKIKQRYDELTKLVVDPEIIADNKEWQKLVKERSSIEEIAECHDKLAKLMKNLEESEQVVKTETDPEMIKMIDLLDQDIKSYYSYISYVQEDREGLNMFSRDTKDF